METPLKSSPSNKPFLEYLTKFTELKPQPSSYEQLISSGILIDLFSLIPKFKLTGQTEDNPKSFTTKFNNFKILFQSIESYWNNNLNCEIDSSDIDLVEICHSGCQVEIDKILELFVKTTAQA